ncbi:hypothetical protein COV19_04110 [Candidatus Woesearchaeota archaeon CG10_big_fil_rev_8_21_14_0_10_44_13]|nr:MAG: hypothetical protein COV19_04110 [Candidatus Woesearchaeota archaeon CG10_big_fil_rev_8_21_14_0_10_44_13]
MTDEKNDRRVRDIMNKIRERIRKRGCRIPHASEQYVDFISQKKDLRRLAEKADVRTDRLITSHRKVVGAPLVRARTFLHEEIMRAVGPMTSKQVDFNRCIAYAVASLQKRIDRIEAANKRRPNAQKSVRAYRRRDKKPAKQIK